MLPTLYTTQLKQIEGLPEAIIRKRGQRLIEVLVRAKEAENKSVIWPAPARGVERDWVADMASRVEAVAENLGVAPQILASSRDYEAIVQTVKNNVPLPSELAGWRSDIVVADLLASLEKRIAGSP